MAGGRRIAHPVGVTLASPPSSDPLAGYPTGHEAFDEAVAPDGTLRPEAEPAAVSYTHLTLPTNREV